MVIVMASSVSAPGAMRQQALLATLGELQSLSDELDGVLSTVNARCFLPEAKLLAEASHKVLATHLPDPRPTIADDFAVMLDSLRKFRIPGKDTEFGNTPTLEQIRQLQGLMTLETMNLLQALEDMGQKPHQLRLISQPAGDVPKAGLEPILRGLDKRLLDVETALLALNNAALEEPAHFQPQKGLLARFIETMKTELGLARLQISVGNSLNLEVLTHIIEVMGELTRNFMSTVNAWRRHISERLVKHSAEVRRRVSRVANGLRTTVKWILHTIRRPEPLAEPRRVMISHSRHDSFIALKLQKDLREMRVTSWVEHNSLPENENTLAEILGAISAYDCLLVVFSGSAANDIRLREEVEHTLNEEVALHRRILIPVVIDDIAMNTHEPWMKQALERRIVDFRNWTIKGTYEESLNELGKQISSG